jgi:hypothetical protein
MLRVNLNSKEMESLTTITVCGLVNSPIRRRVVLWPRYDPGEELPENNTKPHLGDGFSESVSVFGGFRPAPDPATKSSSYFREGVVAFWPWVAHMVFLAARAELGPSLPLPQSGYGFPPKVRCLLAP